MALGVENAPGHAGVVQCPEAIGGQVCACVLLGERSGLPAMHEGSQVTNRAVLVVDDDHDVRQIIAEAIADTGRQVFTAQDGAEALRLLDSPDVPRPCLILLDWSMAPMGGGAFLEQLNGRNDFDQLPILVTSGSPSMGPSSSGFPGVVGTLQKPFDLEDLLAVLDEHCPPPPLVGA
jgi:CheY-like chemotaxis protein